MLLNEIPKITGGRAEAVHKKFEEEECQNAHSTPVLSDHHLETYLSAWAELPGPDNATGPGFQNTAEWILGDRISSKATSLFIQSGWSLHRLLTSTNEELREIGIAFQSDRANILAAVRAFHLVPWRTMQTISLKPGGQSKKHKEHIVFLLETFSRLTLQLYIDAATVAWLRQRIPKKHSDKERLITSVKEAIQASRILINMTEGIYRCTKQHCKNLPQRPVDFIGPKDKKSWPMYKRIVVSSVFLVSVSLLSPFIEEKISRTALSPLCRLPIKWCIVFAWMCV
ncbi:hypothetical protein R5R35_004452 [Gryllus longicercus]|uniref:Uncharacterized protein n=1 Tax=Gryllus longicercus TaxID=2509291 RepID=A0AAN9VDF3_9ORTH